VASQCVEAAMPKCPSRVGRVVKAAGGVNVMGASFGNGVSGSLMREVSVCFDCTRASVILSSLHTNYSFITFLYTKSFSVFWTARRVALARAGPALGIVEPSRHAKGSHDTSTRPGHAAVADLLDRHGRR